MVKFLSEEWITYGRQFMLEKIDPAKDLKISQHHCYVLSRMSPPMVQQ